MTNIEIVKKELQEAYNDDYAVRKLEYRSSVPVTYDELKEVLPIIGQYNNFDPKEVIKGLEEISDLLFYPAREGSVCLYILPPTTYLDLKVIYEMSSSILADEIGLQDHMIRLWWD